MFKARWRARCITCFLLCVVPFASAQIAPVPSGPWQEAVVSVTDLDRSAAFFQEIGDYEVRWRGALDQSLISTWGLLPAASGEAMLIGPKGYDSGLIRLVRFDNAGRKAPTRPGARAWDTGCYYSLMVRMKDMVSIYDDAIEMGWWTETPITPLKFGTSRLKVMVFRGPDGLQVQGYERLEPPLSDEIPEFERLTGPFNVMQMVRDRDAAYGFFTRLLGFGTFYAGEPYLAKSPAHMPLGIPVNLTTSVAYHAAIVYPYKGEFGRMEMIEIIGLDGRDHSVRCQAPNLGILSVRFPVDDAQAAATTIEMRGGTLVRGIERVKLAPYGEVSMFTIKTPDGANIQFFER